MRSKKKSEADHRAETRAKVLAAALPHVAFDGWSNATLAVAVAESGVDAGLAGLVFPRGAVDLALAFHAAGDRRMEAALATEDLKVLRYSDRVARAVWLRLEAVDNREAVRRGAALFALPVHAVDGAAALWRTADAIWQVLGDTSEDVNWYSKRVILSAVYSACVLFWLGDESEGSADTRAFIDRRIGDVMRFEKFEAQLRDNPLGRAFMKGPGRLLEGIRAPGRSRVSGLPGHLG